MTLSYRQGAAGLAGPPSGAGSYTVNASYAGDANYAPGSAPVTGSFTAADRVYDGTTTAAITGRSLDGVLPGDEVLLVGGAASFDSPTVGASKLVTGTSFSLAGAEVGNYTLAASTLTTRASIGAWWLRNFYQPINESSAISGAPGASLPGASAATVWSRMKGGSTVPLKFNLYTASGGAEIIDPSQVAFAVARLNSCLANTHEEPIPVEEFTTGNTGLRYDSVERQLIQNWKTPRVTQESCYRATITARDGSTLSAFFKLR